ncbi:MAG: GH116 family glycosyl-hydrolase, partial [Gemmatimonadaceae bacterium]
MDKPLLPRREFVRRSASALGAVGGMAGASFVPSALADVENSAPAISTPPRVAYDDVYEGARLNRVAFPMGGLGAGMICLEGGGALSHVSIRNEPDVFNAPCIFAAITVKGAKPVARVLEGPVPGWKLFGARNAANGDEGTSYGLPRFRTASFKTRFPFGTVALTDDAIPITARVTGWSPFIPGDDDNSSLPVASLEYRFTNTSRSPIDAVFSFNSKNFLPLEEKDSQAIRGTAGGFVMTSAGKPDEAWKEVSFSASVGDPEALVNLAWFRGGWWDPLTMAWKDVTAGNAYARPAITQGDPSPGATIFVPMRLNAGASRTIA